MVEALIVEMTVQAVEPGWDPCRFEKAEVKLGVSVANAAHIMHLSRAAHLVDGALSTDCIGSMATPNSRSE